ncbi:MAG: HD-GYP domain-containing protein [Nitrospirae bacterium]|nr:HD-GYP domain-containing protein [Nitrospirota bacterium]
MTTKYIEIYDDQYIAIELNNLPLNAPLPCDIFVRDNGLITNLHNKGIIFTHADRERLERNGIRSIYIKERDRTSLGGYAQRGVTKEPDEPKIFKSYSSTKGDYHQIDRLLLIPDTEINFSLFVLNKFNLNAIVSATEKSPVRVDKKILSITGDIVIKKADIPLFRKYLSSVSEKKDIPKEERLRIKAIFTKEDSKILMRELLENPRSGEKIKESKAVVNNMIDCVLENRDAIYDLLSLKNYDYYTYTHSVNVAVLSIGLGVAIELKRDDIEKLGTGSMLHDIGKGSIPHEVLNKQGKLAEEEYKLMKSHVLEGEKILRAHGDFPLEAMPAVLQHHEKLTGKGYPFGLSGDDIKPFGRITAIADCYDALTTQRPYKPAFTPFYALSVVAKETRNYDTELLRAFIKMLGNIG